MNVTIPLSDITSLVSTKRNHKKREKPSQQVEITHKRRSVTTQQEALNQTMIRPSIMSHQNMTLLENQSRPLLNITSETQMKQAVKINELKLHFEKVKQDREDEFVEIRKAEKLEFDLTVKKLEKDNLLRVEIQDQKIAELTS